MTSKVSVVCFCVVFFCAFDVVVGFVGDLEVAFGADVALGVVFGANVGFSDDVVLGADVSGADVVFGAGVVSGADVGFGAGVVSGADVGFGAGVVFCAGVVFGVAFGVDGLRVVDFCVKVSVDFTSGFVVILGGL